MADITPRFMFDLQSNLRAKYSNGWARVLNQLWWDRVAIRRESTTRRELVTWLLETAQIRNTGSKGTELDFEDIASMFHEAENENFGSALRLSRNEIEDDLYDKAAQWSAQIGSAASYHPQDVIAKLILGGKVNVGYDKKPFFSTQHPVNPYDDAAGTYSNLFTGKPLTAANVAAVAAEIAKVKQPSGKPRYLRPSILVVDPSNQLNANMITGAEFFTDPTNVSGGAPATNIIKQSYGFAQPIVADELIVEPGVWYVGVEANQDALEGAFVYQQRKPFELTSYTGMSEAELDRINEFEWHLRGRNAGVYGHPYLFFRCEPT